MKTITLTILLTANTIIGVFGQNLISNPSFETGGQVNCQSWFDFCGQELTYLCDTITPDTCCCVQFYQDAPIGGGIWGIRTSTGMLPTYGLAKTYITGLSLSGIFQLKYWMITFNSSSGITEISHISQGQIIKKKISSNMPTNWNQFTITDTFTLLNTDTISIKFWDGGSPIDLGLAGFDLVELTIIDTLSSIININPSKAEDIIVYPNPSRKSITIEIKGGKNENHKLTIYNSTGQIIRTVNSDSDILTLDNTNITKGLYFYQFSDRHGNILDTDKFVIE